MALIVIDPGHGGKAPGALYDGIKESDLNLNIALLLKRRAHPSIEWRLTRTGDEYLSLSERAKLSEGVDAFISIHQNASLNEEAEGNEVFYYSGSVLGKRLAGGICNGFKIYMSWQRQRGVFANDKLYVLKNSKCPSVLIECGFLSNPFEREKLKDISVQESIVSAIYYGIDLWLKG